MADLFISYSREDSDIARRLQAKLTEEQRDVWIDWEDLPATAEWWEKIRDSILTSDNFLIIISPNSIASPICHLEIACAIELHKRTVPIKYRDTDETEAFATLISQPLNDFQRALLQGRNLLAVARDNWQVLAGLNWIDFTDDPSFQEKSQELLNAVDTDAEYVDEHTRLLVQATDWDNRKRNPDRLLREDELMATEAWLKAIGDRVPPLDDSP